MGPRAKRTAAQMAYGGHGGILRFAQRLRRGCSIDGPAGTERKRSIDKLSMTVGWIGFMFHLHHPLVGQLLEAVVPPDRNATIPLTFRADWLRAAAGTHHARRPIDISPDDRMHLAYLGDLLQRRLRNLPLRIKTQPLDPFPVIAEQVAAFVKSDLVRVRQQV